MQNLTIEEVQPLPVEIVKEHLEKIEKEQAEQQQEQPTDNSEQQQ